jgi:hypothetical protein
MKKFQYQVLRYIPDRVAGEFINLGIVIYEPVERKLAGKFISRIGNIPALFPSTNSRYLLRCIRGIEEQLNLLSGQFSNEIVFDKTGDIDAVTRTILPKDDTSLVFSEVKMALDISINALLHDFFVRYVRTQVIEEDDEVRRDKEVWHKVYKTHFEQEGIVSNLITHKVKTKDDELEFDRAWKNGAWNFFETVSFNLNRADAIKNKVYRWMGKLDELDKAKEPLHIYLLSVMPHDHPELEKFITKKLREKSTEHTTVEIVKEENVANFTRRIRRQMDKHENEQH